MIAKIIDYCSEDTRTAHLCTASRRALMAGLAVSSYVLELDAQALVEGATSELPENLSRYLTKYGDNVERVKDSKIFNLPGDTVEEQIIAFGFLVATYGIKSLRQIVFSYGQNSVTPEMAARHRDLLLKILKAENYPGTYALHGDTPYPHGHIAICLVNIETGERGDWAQGREVEALHIAAAICVFQDQLRAEPNRRYVADETGVYHTWSGIRVADADGTITRRGVFKRILASHIAFKKAVRPGPGFCAGEALSTPEAVRLLGRGAVREVKSWEAFHRSLARVGLRYEPYIADGEIEGGYIVPNLAFVDDAHKVKGSKVNAGYKRLVKKLRGKYQPPPLGLNVQPFLHPTYRGLDDEEAEEENAPSLKREQSAQIKKEIEELAAHLERERGRQDENERIAAEAEKAKLEKDRSAKLAVHNARQKAQKARREADEELIAGLKVSAQQSDAKPKRGRRAKAKPIPGVFWGDPQPNPSAAADWRKRYDIETHGPKTTYSVNQTPAFVETKNFVAMHRQDRQAAMDALRCAHEKFGTVKITGTREFRREMLLLALEMEIPLDIRHTIEVRKLRKEAEEAKARATAKSAQESAKKAGAVVDEANASIHRANVRASQNDDPKGAERKGCLTEKQKQQQAETKPAHTSSGVDAKPAVSPKPQSEAVRPPPPDRHAKSMPPKPSPVPPRQTHAEKEDVAARTKRGSVFTDDELERLFKLNRDKDRHGDRELAVRYAHDRLERAPFDEMLLSASVFVNSDKRVRYLDDEVLLKHFHDQPQTLVRPEIQRHLAAIAAVHKVRRKWIMAQCAAGKISRDGTEFDIDHEIFAEHENWLLPFIRGQVSDPKFLRQVDEASVNRVEVPAIRLDLRPDLQLWQRMRAGQPCDEDLVQFVADELFRTSTPEERETIFKKMRYQDAQSLRETEGRWRAEYKGWFYRKPEETDAQWKRRRKIIQKNEHRSQRGW